MNRSYRPLLLAAVLVGALAAPGAAETRLLRFPDIHGDRVVFTYAGDLWLAPADGGRARQLTTHPGVEVFAKFSPDGRWIAFTGQVDGDEQVYVMPAEGGVPRQLTFYPASGPLPPRWGYDNQVYGWHPDGRRVLFRSHRDGFSLGDTRLYLVSVDGGLPAALPMPESGGGALSADGSSIVYSPVSRDFRHWKRYEGGWAQDLYLFDLETYDSQRITDHPRSDRDPMWIGGKVYFSSDRDGKLNLFVWDPDDRTTTQLTRGATWDVRWPSADEASGRIVYELDGELVVFDIASGGSTEITIDVPTDALARRPHRIEVEDYVEDIGLSPSGERALFVARGDLFTVPAEHGVTRNLTRSSGAHDREAVWSPDGEWIAYVSDADGEEEIYLVDHLARRAPRRLTDGSKVSYSELDFSPDSGSIAYRDHTGRLLVVSIDSGTVTEVVQDASPFGLSYSWSPDGRYLAYAELQENGNRCLFVWDRQSGEATRVTDALWNAYSPSFGKHGDYLYYLSDREFSPQLGAVEFNYVVNRETYLYALALRQDVPHPFPPRNDEVGEDEDDESGDENGSEDEGRTAESEDRDDEVEEPEPVRIDFEGLARRVARVPLEADNYAALLALEDGLLFVRGSANYYGRESERRPSLEIFDFEKRETRVVAKQFSDAAIADDGKTALVGDRGKYRLVSLASQRLREREGDEDKVLDLKGLVMEVDPQQEWRQIFAAVWRRFRDFFYVENMHGYDWQALRAQYEPLLEHVGHRSDLNYVMSEMLAELEVSHAYVAGGDLTVPERPHPGLLGARFELDEGNGRYRFARIFSGQNEEEEYRSPLREVGVGIEEGDYLFEINGVPVVGATNPYSILRSAGGSAVELRVGSGPAIDDSRYVLVDPIADEDGLLYLEWVLRNRRTVSEAGDGRIGYLHLPDMGAAGISEWIKWFYGQIRLQGLIVDVRSNGGGNVSQMIIPRLMRRLLMLDYERHQRYPDTYPDAVFTGKLVCLLDEDTASDGDQFAYAFRAAGLGPLIGKRSWGGVVGIYGRGGLIDGGSVSVPEAGTADASGQWAIEGHGVDPDIVVEQDPKLLIEGTDSQLQKAIEVLLEEIEADPPVLPSRPAPPVRDGSRG